MRYLVRWQVPSLELESAMFHHSRIVFGDCVEHVIAYVREREQLPHSVVLYVDEYELGGAVTTHVPGEDFWRHVYWGHLSQELYMREASRYAAILERLAVNMRWLVEWSTLHRGRAGEIIEIDARDGPIVRMIDSSGEHIEDFRIVVEAPDEDYARFIASIGNTGRYTLSSGAVRIARRLNVTVQPLDVDDTLITQIFDGHVSARAADRNDALMQHCLERWLV